MNGILSSHYNQRSNITDAVRAHTVWWNHRNGCETYFMASHICFEAITLFPDVRVRLSIWSRQQYHMVKTAVVETESRRLCILLSRILITVHGDRDEAVRFSFEHVILVCMHPFCSFVTTSSIKLRTVFSILNL